MMMATIATSIESFVLDVNIVVVSTSVSFVREIVIMMMMMVHPLSFEE
jgi:hypothetical protein